jgi:hypothetical protein
MAMSRKERRLWLNELSRINGQITSETNSFVQSLMETKGE